MGALGTLPRTVGLLDDLDERLSDEALAAKCSRESAFPGKVAHRALSTSVRDSAYDLRLIGKEAAGREDALDATVRAAFGLAVLPLLARGGPGSDMLPRYLAALRSSHLRRATLCLHRAHAAAPAAPAARASGSSEPLEVQLADCLPKTLEVLVARALDADTMAPALARLLSAPKSNLTILDVSCCSLSAHGAALLGGALGASRTLASLSLRANPPLEPHGVRAIGDGVRACKTLLALHLDGTRVGRAGAEALASALRAGCALAELRMAACDLADDGAAALCDALKRTPTLHTLGLERNGLARAAPDALAALLAVKRCALRELLLSHNQIGELGADALGGALGANASLETLDLSSNPLGDSGLVVLASRLGGNGALTDLRLSNVQCDDAGAAALGHALGSNRTIRSLDISSNPIGDAGARALAKGLEDNVALVVLDLRATLLADQGAIAVVDALEAHALEDGDGQRVKRRIALARSQITADLPRLLNSSVHV